MSASRTLLITGGAGMLASDLARHFTSVPGYDVTALSRERLDVVDGSAVKVALEALQPWAVIHTAALHVDACEASPAEAYRVNGWAARTLGRACERYSAVFIYISTCGLFGDTVRPYSEYDPVELKTVYARSKYHGERFVQQFCSRYFIIRPGWLYGGVFKHGKNFVARRYEQARREPVVRSVYDKYGSPTYTGDVALAIERLLETEEYGIYHIANAGGCTRAEYVRHILRSFGLSTPVEEVDSSHYPRPAKVPACEILESLNLTFARLPTLPAWEESLERYVRIIAPEVKGT